MHLGTHPRFYPGSPRRCAGGRCDVGEAFRSLEEWLCLGAIFSRSRSAADFASGWHQDDQTDDSRNDDERQHLRRVGEVLACNDQSC